MDENKHGRKIGIHAKKRARGKSKIDGLSDYETIIYLYTQYAKAFHLSQQDIDDVDMGFFFDQMIVMEKEKANENTKKARVIEDMGF